jgi:hypothetical protein
MAVGNIDRDVLRNQFFCGQHVDGLHVGLLDA